MGRRIVTVAVVVVAALVVAFLLGPRVKVDTTVSFDPAAIGPDPEAYLATQEAAVKAIRPGFQKEIIWANPATKAKTPIQSSMSTDFPLRNGRSVPSPTKSRPRSGPTFSIPASQGMRWPWRQWLI